MKILYLIASMLLISIGVMCRNQKPKYSGNQVIIGGDTTFINDTAINMGNNDRIDTVSFVYRVSGIIPITAQKSKWTDASKADRGLVFTITPIDTFTPKPLKIKMKPRWWDSITTMQQVFDADSVYFSSGGTVGIPIDSGYLESWGKIGDQHYDTIHCVMLVSDSSIVNGFRSQRSYWIYGNCIRYYSDPFWGDYYSTIGYLDENKKPLPKNIIVWLSK